MLLPRRHSLDCLTRNAWAGPVQPVGLLNQKTGRKSRPLAVFVHATAAWCRALTGVSSIRFVMRARRRAAMRHMYVWGGQSKVPKLFHQALLCLVFKIAYLFFACGGLA